MNLFKKALIAVLGLELVVAPSANKQVEEVQAAAGGTATLKLSSSTWGSANAYYTIHYWGGDTATSWPGSKFNAGKAAKGSVEITANYDETSTNCIIIRWGDSACTKEWNRWDYFDKNTMTTKYNYFTNTSWDSCSSTYVASTVEKAKYTYTYYDGSEKLGTDTLIEGDTWNGKFFEKEGYRFEGWYTDANLTKAYATGTLATANTSLYAKYVEAEDYKIYFDDNGIFGATVDAYFFGPNGDNGWPGKSMTKEANGLWSYTVDASKGFNSVIFGNGENKTLSTGDENSKWAQTVDLSLDFDKTVLYTLGAKDSKQENKYVATVADYNHLNGYYQTKGENSIRFIGVFGVAGSSHFAIADYASVGFKVVSGENEKEVDSGYVYTSVVANGETISATTYNADYFFVLTFNNVPADTEITVTPFAKLANGTVCYGTAVSYAF